MRWFFLILVSFNAYAEEWKAADYWMLGAATTLLVADWGQTRDLIVSNDTCQKWVDNPTSQGIGTRLESYPCRRKESNPILGDYPTQKEVDQYFALAILGTAGLSYVLPQTYRRFFLGGVIALQSYVVLKNHQVGLRINF